MSQKGEELKENEENFLCQGLAFIIRERELTAKKVIIDIYLWKKGKKVYEYVSFHVSFDVSFMSLYMSIFCGIICMMKSM